MVNPVERFFNVIYGIWTCLPFTIQALFIFAIVLFVLAGIISIIRS